VDQVRQDGGRGGAVFRALFSLCSGLDEGLGVPSAVWQGNLSERQDPKQTDRKQMKTNTFERYVCGWAQAVAACDDGAFSVSSGLPTNAETARAVLYELLRQRGFSEAERESSRDPVPALWVLESFFATLEGWDELGRVRTPLLRFSAFSGAEKLWASVLASGLDRELRRAAWASGEGYSVKRAARLWRDRCAPVQEETRTFIQKIRTKPLCPDTFKYDRAVGVEMECFGEVARKALVEALPLWAGVTGDGSISPSEGQAHEVRVLLVRRELEPRLFRLCKRLEALGLRVNRSCGLHVHLDQRGQTEAQVEKRAKVMDAWLCALQELVPASRRDNSYCRFGTSWKDRYHAVNLCAFSAHKTLEVRLHSGTTDYTKILAWVRLLELLAALRSKPKAGGCLAVLEQLPLAAHDLAYWRSRHAALNPHLYGSNAQQEVE
jgi:hypothetical protein